jgi:hypothetical protein
VSLADDILRAVREGAEDGMRLAAEAILEEAKRNVPVGDPKVDPDPNVSLRDSGKVERDPDGNGYRITFDTPYAAYVHENLHARHPRGGGPKFLERALTTLGPQLDRFVATAVQPQIDRRGGKRGARRP